MAQTFDQHPIQLALAAIARDFHQRGWMPGTAGNLSARGADQDDSFWITASGRPKGSLEQTDFLEVAIADGSVITRLQTDSKPSAETSIHQAIYRLFPEARACFHVHSVDACIACESAGASDQQQLRLPPLEVIKGLDIWVQDPVVDLPLFENILDVPRIAETIEQRFTNNRPPVPALMIHRHGITVWGNSLQQAYNRVEIVEFIMSYLARTAH